MNDVPSKLNESPVGNLTEGEDAEAKEKTRYKESFELLIYLSTQFKCIKLKTRFVGARREARYVMTSQLTIRVYCHQNDII